MFFVTGYLGDMSRIDCDICRPKNFINVINRARCKLKINSFIRASSLRRGFQKDIDFDFLRHSSRDSNIKTKFISLKILRLMIKHHRLSRTNSIDCRVLRFFFDKWKLVISSCDVQSKVVTSNSRSNIFDSRMLRTTRDPRTMSWPPFISHERTVKGHTTYSLGIIFAFKHPPRVTCLYRTMSCSLWKRRYSRRIEICIRGRSQ